MEAACKMAIRFYIADDEGRKCSDAISNGALACHVKEFLGSGLPAGAIEKAGSYDDKIIDGAQKCRTSIRRNLSSCAT